MIVPAGYDSSLDVLESLKNQEERISQVIVVRGNHPSRNRNKGIERAGGDFVAFVNAHSSFPGDWSKNIISFFNDFPEIDIVGGPQLTPESNNFFGKVSGFALGSKFGAGNVAKRYSLGKLNLNADEESITSSNLICKKDVFEKVRFDENIYPGEDPKFISDAKKQHLRVAYCPKIVGYNKRRNSVRGLIRQIFNYGKMRPKKEALAETMKKPFFLIPSLFFLYVVSLFLIVGVNASITGNIIGAAGFRGNPWLFLPLGGYILLAILFSFYDSIKNKNLPAFFILPFIYPMIHLSYGMGMVLGYIKKISKRQ